MKTTIPTLALLAISAILPWGNHAGAQPDWNVNAADFQYTMTATGSGIFDCVSTANPDDRVAFAVYACFDIDDAVKAQQAAQ